MSGIKQLAGQTLWYGVSSIAARFINYLLTPYLTYILTKEDFGRMGAVYSLIPLFNVIFTYGLETSYFRFVQNKERKETVNTTATISIIITTLILFALLWFNQNILVNISSLNSFPQLIQLSLVIIALDALSTIPFARIRNEGRPKLYAFIKVIGIVLNIGFTLFFLSYCPAQLKQDPNSWVSKIYDPNQNPVTYILWANVLQSAFTLFILFKWLLPKNWKFDWKLWKEMMIYSLPMLIVGMGGMINEVFDRLMLGWWLPPNINFDEQRGIYNACYKLSILITLFIQAFRMGAEPFFFKQAEGANPQRVYARVMKFFVITVSVMFLVVALYIPVWKWFIHEKHWEGLKVVPILLLANMFLGIYYNLSVWYKVTNRTMAGAVITLIGCIITIGINWLFIPRFGYMACAWATFFCYGTMMVLSFTQGQKEYYIPYAWKKLTAYMVISLILFFLHRLVLVFSENIYIQLITASVLILAFLYFLFRIERKEFQKLPVIGRFIP